MYGRRRAACRGSRTPSSGASPAPSCAPACGAWSPAAKSRFSPGRRSTAAPPLLPQLLRVLKAPDLRKRLFMDEIAKTDRQKASRIAGRRMLVTGGAGTIGSTLVDQLIAKDAAEVVVLDNFVRGRRSNLESAAATGNLTVVEGDVRDKDLVRELTEGM